MFSLFKASAIVSIATILNILVGFIRSKFTAVNLGPSGVGVFSQANNFQQLLVTMASLGISVGLIKYVSKYREENDALKIEGVIACGFWLQVIACIISVILVAFCSGFLSRLLFSTADYGAFLIAVSIGASFCVVAAIIENVLFGYGMYKMFVKARSLMLAKSDPPVT